MISDEEDEDLGRPMPEAASTNSLTEPLLSSGQSNFSSSRPATIPLTSALYIRNVRMAKICVMLTVILERCAYYSFLGNLAYFININLGWASSHTAMTTLIFSGLTWVSCFIGGFLGDAHFGRHKTIAVGLFLYIIGFASLPALAYFTQGDDNEKGSTTLYKVWFVATLVVVSLGEGCFKSNMSPFGADQLTHAHEDEMRTFFNIFYWAINVGSFIGFGPCTLLQQQKGFVWGYGVSAGCIVLASIIFCIPRVKNYHIAHPASNIMKRTIKICMNARRNKQQKPTSTAGGYEDYVPVQHWLDRAMVKYGGSYLDAEVQEVKILFSILPVFLFFIMYCTCYYQVSGTFLLQGLRMRTYKIHENMPVPAAWLGLFNICFVLVFVPIVDKLLYPCLEKLGFRIPLLFRISVGMVLASLSMASAGVVELHRKEANGTWINHINHVNITAKDVSIFLQVPQYGLMGISEIFVLITGLEFAYSQAPRSMQSFVTGIFFVANGIGAFVGSLIIYIGDKYFHAHFLSLEHDDIYVPEKDDSNLYMFFFILAAGNLLNWIIFVIYGSVRTRKKRRKELEQTVAAFIKGSIEASMERSAKT